MKHEDLSSVHAQHVVSARSVRARSIYRTWGKRALDLVLSLIVLPLVLTVCFGIWIMHRGSNQKLFYSQPRVGKNGKIFNCYKFKTMVDDAESVLDDLCQRDPKIKAEWDTYQKLRNDPRITSAGHFLRKTSLDELPQVFNVLRGDMSLVGPRPFMVDQDDLYRAAGGRAYYQMKPGITGKWQVEGRGKSSFQSRVQFDESYHRNVSMEHDVSLMFSTLRVVIGRSGS